MDGLVFLSRKISSVCSATFWSTPSFIYLAILVKSNHGSISWFSIFWGSRSMESALCVNGTKRL
jgi:hypothetical protein